MVFPDVYYVKLVKDGRESDEKNIILITGGAGEIGYQIIEVLHNQNNKIYFTYCNNKEKAENTEEEFSDREGPF